MPKRDGAYMAGRREAILDAAFACLKNGGMAGLTTTALCAEAGISMGALYTHFKTKDDVLQALAERGAHARRAEFDFHDAKEMREGLLGVMQKPFDRAFVEGFRAELELLLRDHNDPNVAETARDFTETPELMRTIKRLIRVGELRADLDPKAAATAISVMMVGAMMFGLMGARPATPLREAMALLLNGVIGPGKRTKK